MVIFSSRSSWLPSTLFSQQSGAPEYLVVASPANPKGDGLVISDMVAPEVGPPSTNGHTLNSIWRYPIRPCNHCTQLAPSASTQRALGTRTCTAVRAWRRVPMVRYAPAARTGSAGTRRYAPGGAYLGPGTRLRRVPAPPVQSGTRLRRVPAPPVRAFGVYRAPFSVRVPGEYSITST